jgi:hypothetical protein
VGGSGLGDGRFLVEGDLGEFGLGEGGDGLDLEESLLAEGGGREVNLHCLQFFYIMLMVPLLI